ncbi:acyl--CoA ligase [Photobacterium sp. WH77]|uniref:class I adenylate-forming enzyme family protein n=1 Tax=unclassified Photobacterium TaxID=2628852 RepID=UPI001EDAAD76|nr:MULTISPECIES: class I adenylate-forming enzyme family protein [unclassified Photobacterium]MCG2839058.1 acyl--CoA ligase [Photobacterium sp. WH77]MCG2846675.1 acyl--CoA ligase [Photobacterium sp. WH80]MDO6582512.1 class I adenylate-forming enzyme family protein [Photobacterium sp. 2_MG-2023]
MNSAGIINLVPTQVRTQWKAEGAYPDITVFDAFTQQARRQPDAIAVCSSEGSHRFEEIYQHSLKVANGLAQAGMVKGDVLVYQLGNSWRSLVIDMAAAAIGVVVCPIPPGRGKLDIESILKRCQARAIIVEHHSEGEDVCAMLETLRPLLLSLRLLITVGEQRQGWCDFADLLNASALPECPALSPDDPVRFLVSSGTESEPKLVAYSHNALLGGRGRFMALLSDGKPRFAPLYLMPLGSAFGSTASSCVMALLGGTVIILPKFSVDAAIDAIRMFRPTHVLGVPTMFQRLASDDRLAALDLRDLVALVSGGALIDEATINRCYEAFGCQFINLYGSADGVNCFNALTDSREKVAATVGKPDPSICEIRVVDDHHQPLEQGEIGEIAARGPITPMQYVNSPVLDETYRDQQGWVYTGDLGCIDSDGYLNLMGRKKDVIIRGGVNISPAQIEKLMTQHPNVVSASCVAVPDHDLGQRVCICLSLQQGTSPLSLNDVTQYLHQQGLEKHKWPEFLSHFSQLPLSPAGKVDKPSITKWLASLPQPEQSEASQVSRER